MTILKEGFIQWTSIVLNPRQDCGSKIGHMSIWVNNNNNNKIWHFSFILVLAYILKLLSTLLFGVTRSSSHTLLTPWHWAPRGNFSPTAHRVPGRQRSLHLEEERRPCNHFHWCSSPTGGYTWARVTQAWTISKGHISTSLSLGQTRNHQTCTAESVLVSLLCFLRRGRLNANNRAAEYPHALVRFGRGPILSHGSAEAIPQGGLGEFCDGGREAACVHFYWCDCLFQQNLKIFSVVMCHSHVGGKKTDVIPPKTPTTRQMISGGGGAYVENVKSWELRYVRWLRARHLLCTTAREGTNQPLSSKK